MPNYAYDPPVSEAQRRAMYAAAGGHSTLGIPKKVGEEFVGKAKDMDPRQWGDIFKGIGALARFFSEEQREPEHQSTDALRQGADALPLAAGVVNRAKDGSVLLLRRSGAGDHAGEWCWPGGHAEAGEDAEAAARRECLEETGYAPKGEMRAADRSHGEADFTTFVHDVDGPFEPKLNGEHDRWCWAQLDALPEPLHPGVRATLGRDAESENAAGKLSERTREHIGTVGSKQREGLSEGDFLEPASKKYPVKEGGKYSRKLLLAAAREARMHGHEDLAKRADVIREREFGGASDMALDRESVRSYDADGRLHVETTPISKANVCEYYGHEIPGCEELGLDPERRYRLLRHPGELKKAADTFNNLPVLSEHVPVTVDEHPKELVIGSTGTDAAFKHPYLSNSLVFWSRDGVDGVETGAKKELSSAYRYKPDMTPGEYEGEPYDGVMRDIVGNHVALVKTGRAGPDVVVGDSQTQTMERFDMSKVVLSRFAAVCQGAMAAYLAPKLAQDAKVDLASVFDGVSKKNFKEMRPKVMERLRAVTKGKLAKDATIDGAEKAMEHMDGAEVAEGMDTDENSGLPMSEEEMRKKAARDAEPVHHRIAKFLEGKVAPEHMAAVRKMIEEHEGGHAADEPPEFEGKPKVGEGPEPITKKAMDAALAAQRETIKAEQKAIRDAENFVRPWVGNLAIACDSAEAVLRAAAGALKVKGADTMHPDALRTVIEMQPKPGERKARVAQDEADRAASTTAAADYGKLFPGAARIGHQG